MRLKVIPLMDKGARVFPHQLLRSLVEGCCRVGGVLRILWHSPLVLHLEQSRGQRKPSGTEPEELAVGI